MSILVDDKPSYEMTVKERKARRIYQRMLTGLTIARNQGKEMRFLTLTTSKEKRYSWHFETQEDGTKKLVQNTEPRTLKESFDILRQRIKAATIKKDKFTGFNLNKYYCLRTEEGNGVLHIIFWGGLYIPIQWLKAAWYEIHGAYEVFIEFVHNKKDSVNRLVGYLLDRYLLNQPIERMSYGWGWAWLGFCKSWQKIKYIYKCVGLKRRKAPYIFPGIASFHYYYTTKTHLRINLCEGFKNGYYRQRNTNQLLPFWKGVLWQPPKTSRQTKLYYPKSGFNKKYF